MATKNTGAKTAEKNASAKDPMAWREAPATDEQYIKLCKDLRMTREELGSLTKGEASDKITEVIKRQRAARREPPTETQLRFLEDNGYNRKAMAVRTKGFCSDLIYKIKSGQVAVSA